MADEGAGPTYTFIAAADNYEPAPRNYLAGELATNRGYDNQSHILTFTDEAPRDAHHAIYVLDYGDRVEARWVAGWSHDYVHFYLQPFPLSGGARADGRGTVDMSGWMLGPRRSFHLKLTKVGA